MRLTTIGLCLLMLSSVGCSDDDGGGDNNTNSNSNQPGVDAGPGVDSGPILQDGGVIPPAPACDPAPGGGSSTVAEPTVLVTLADRWHEAWLASPAVADLDEDGTPEIVIARAGLLLVWHADGTEVWRADTEGRTWASPVVGDLVPGIPGLEVALAAREYIYAFDAQGNDLPGFPVTWRDELRTLAAGDIDGDGEPELVAVTTSRLEANDRRDIIIAFHMDGSQATGFPPNTTGASGCDDACYVTGGYDQNVALGDVNGDNALDIFATQDNAYMSLHDGAGVAFDSNAIFAHPTKFSGVRFLHDYDLAQQGWANDEATANQAHFTNSAPAIADVDGDGSYDLVVLGSVQNAAQSDRLRGVGLWVLHPDGSRLTGWETPFHAPDYLAGLWDYDGTNVVAATNQVTVADLDPDSAGPEFVFAGFDGRIHCVDALASEVWSFTYTTDARVLTGGVLVADLSGDGAPEVVFASYSPDENKSHLFVLDGGGNLLHQLALPMRGAMAVPTIADADGDGTLEIVVNLKDGEDQQRMVLVYTVPGSSDNCLLWPTGRGNLMRNGFVP